ncbi:MAG TPA: OmpH family outer membrane protein [Candidatus Polarisedimenticolia bacterium]|nr:OmpH family outer membrane protein [Candidatus Polarisedimenticolia bacterium]
MRKTRIPLVMVLALLPSLAAAQAPAALRVGVVNQDRVLNESDEGKRLKAELEKLRAAKATTIEAKEKEIKEIQEQLLNAQLSLSEEKREEIQRQLKRKRVEYERLNDDASAEFQDAANRAQGRLIALFRDVIAKYGAEQGYTLILERNTLYFAAGSVDITDELLARFNQSTRGAAGAAPPGN